MKRILSLLFVLTMLFTFVSCDVDRDRISFDAETRDYVKSDATDTGNGSPEGGKDGNTDNSGNADNSATGDNGGNIGGGTIKVPTNIINVTDAFLTGYVSGDYAEAFKGDTGNENTVISSEGASIPHSIYACLQSPTVITSFTLKTPSENIEYLHGATIQASRDGINWITLKTIDDSFLADREYFIEVIDSTQYSFVRVRQAESNRGEVFIFRSLVICGTPYTGEAGKLSDIVMEKDPSVLVGISSYVATNRGEGELVDVFRDNDKSWTAYSIGDTTPNMLTVTLSEPTQITKLTVKLWNSNRRPRGTVIEASVDGEAWTELYVIEDLRQSDGVTVLQSGEWTHFVNDNTKYTYVRLKQREDLAPWMWTLDTVLIYGITSTENVWWPYESSKNVTYNKDYSLVDPVNSNDDPRSVFDLSNTKSSYDNNIYTGTDEDMAYMIAGEFYNPVMITRINYYCPSLYASRARASYFEASVDGKNWVRIATLPKFYEDNLFITVNVEADTDVQYKYIRLVQRETFSQYMWTVGTVEVFGISYSY